MIATLRVDASAIVGQNRIVEAVTKEYLPLLEKLSNERVENIINQLLIELRRLIFSYNVTTVIADGTRKTIRTLRYRGDVKSFTAAFWTRELYFTHC
ncbi:hypothetical protein ABWM37_10800 [Klebsiella michiganensis]|uniref:hypothetical protein n=1 Tax=Klebsiella michiganensis TaxID=1134687 RepID=UPI0037531AD6